MFMFIGLQPSLRKVHNSSKRAASCSHQKLSLMLFLGTGSRRNVSPPGCCGCCCMGAPRAHPKSPAVPGLQKHTCKGAKCHVRWLHKEQQYLRGACLALFKRTPCKWTLWFKLCHIKHCSSAIISFWEEMKGL
ncbi:hypothetical protein DUNSADRAFT_8512 [Dunaliella salina]|uniref:Encoded protein n=1 Tax=Dunaliella salina TaxID=3046 RepID=A0ABQ7GJA0_DUNSA|nr:hypothetical protein DUNSADRAFT_8512 [Dunaliella salina]|eukprot:KAF5834687.1 hypothetical protein DUNSADRAFT_8512 [Dunaliella salina]